MFFDLHRHDEDSLFDGFGKPVEVVARAKELGHDAVAVSNHGNISTNIAHYYACKEAEIKPILGSELYFMPEFEKTRDSFHLCLYVKNIKGYKNLNRMITVANKKKFYYKAVVDFELLEKYSDGLICTSACIAGALSQAFVEEKDKRAYKLAKKFKNIFGDDFYIEIQPYKISEKGVQEHINVKLMELATELNIKCVLTSDSHFIKEEDFDSYLKLHEIGGHLELGKHYEERYIPSKNEIAQRFMTMHTKNLGQEEARQFVKECFKTFTEIYNKVDDEILEKLPLKLPSTNEEEDSNKALWNNIKSGLKAKGKYEKEYIERCKFEFDVIAYHGFEAYFLIVEDYVKWAKSKGITVGPGRGSVCNCLVAYALDITDVDSIFFDLDFNRFLRKDKKKLPKQHWAYSVNCANRCAA